MKGVYKIKNVITGEFYIGSTEDLSRRLLSHKLLLKNNKHTNYKLQESYNKYGKDCFVFYELREVPVETTKESLILMEQECIDKSDICKLFNLRLKVTASKTTPIMEICCIINLKNEIIKTFESLSEGFRYLGSPISVEDLNTNKIYKSKYRIVTKDFFDENIEIIMNWDCGNNNYMTSYHKDSEKTYFKNCKLYCDINEKVLEFDNYEHLSADLNITQSGVIQILKGKKQNNPFNIRTIK